MTNRRKRVYEIALIVCCFIIIGLSAYMGITAIQKSMTLKMQFEMTPAVAVKLEIYNTSTSQWDVVFQNSGQVKIKDGVTLNGNTLGFRSEYANGLGNEFTLKITSLSSSKILAELIGASFSQSKLLFTDSTPQTVDVDAVDNLTIDFSKVVQVSITDNSNSGLTLDSENLVEFTQNQQTTYYAKTHQALVLVYDVNSSHKNHSINATINSENVGEITTENNQMTLSIPANALTSDVAITLSAEMNQLTVNYNGLTNINSSNTTTILQPNTEYTTILTVDESAVDIDDYSLPEILNIQIGEATYDVSKYETDESGITYSESYNYTTNQIEGTITIPEGLTKGNISITASAEIAYWDGNYPESLKTVGGTGSEADPFLIATAKELASLTGNIYDCVKLIKNIYLNKGSVGENGGITSHYWANQMSCYGIFDGDNFKISGIYIKQQERGGLFIDIGEAEVKDLTIVNSYISADDAGAIAGYVGGPDITFSNIVVGEENNKNSVVITGKCAGGILGNIDLSNHYFFTSCTNYATITGTECAGGMVGYVFYTELFSATSPPEYTSCQNKGVVNGPAGYTGDLSGYTYYERD